MKTKPKRFEGISNPGLLPTPHIPLVCVRCWKAGWEAEGPRGLVKSSDYALLVHDGETLCGKHMAETLDL